MGKNDYLSLRIRFLKFVGHCGAREILKIFIYIRTRISHLLLDRSDFSLRNILKLLFMISFLFPLASESDRNEINSSSDSYEPASCNESYDESALAKGSNHEPPKIEQRNRENTSSASTDPRRYFVLADFV